MLCRSTTDKIIVGKVRFPALHTKLIQAKIENIVVTMRYKTTRGPTIFMLHRDTM